MNKLIGSLFFGLSCIAFNAQAFNPLDVETIQGYKFNHTTGFGEFPAKPANGRYFDLSSADLHRLNLFRADLNGANLTKANLSWAILTGADLSGADLSEANLRYAYLPGADLTEAYLLNTDLTAACLTEADLTNAHLAWANLTETCLTEAYLIMTDLTGANLTHATLEWTELTGAIFEDTILAGAILTKKQLSYIEQSNADRKLGSLSHYSKNLSGQIDRQKEVKIRATARVLEIYKKYRQNLHLFNQLELGAGQ